MKIKSKLIIAFLLISLLPLTIASIFSYINTKKAFTQEVLNKLESVAEIQKNRVSSIIDQNLERLVLVSSRTQLRLSLDKFISNPKSEHREMMEKILLDARTSISDFRNISILTLDGEIVASTDITKIGTNHFNKEFFIRGQKENIADVYSIDKNKNLNVYLAGPLYLEKRLLGIVVIESIADNILSLVKDYSGLGKTGETILAKRNKNGEALFIGPLRFDPDAALRRSVPKDALNDPITQSLLKKEQIFIKGVDYREKPVLAVTKYIEEIDWGLVVKIDRVEAFAYISRLNYILVAIIFISIVLVVFISLYIARSITRPIADLTQVAVKISKGDLSKKVEIKSKDETGILAKTLNKMTNNLIQDIKERRLAEEQAKKLKERLQIQIDRMPIGLIMLNTDFTVQSWNPSAEKIFGFTEVEAIGKKPHDFIVPKDAQPHVDDIWRRLLEGDMTAHSTNENITKDGRTILCEWVNVPIKKDSETVMGVMSMVQDITERNQLEGQFRQAQKMEAIGRLTGGIAHDFNNILTGIIGYSDYLLMSQKYKDPIRKFVEEIKKAAERAASLTNKLLAFSRKQILQTKILNVNTLITDLEKMIQRIIGEDIMFISNLETGIGNIQADQAQIEQVIMNLIVNARDAMPKGGKLTIETANVTLDEEYTKSHVSVKPGSYIMIAVSDNGIGMDREIQEHIFDPFFTTKEQDKGTGLGLSTVYGIVKQSGGNIWLYSEAGHGTTFKIYLPKVEEKVVPASKHKVSLESLKGKETIMLVEDEDAVRAMMSLTLKHYGYNILETPSPLEALIICEKHKEPIQMMVTDVILPEMNGRELAEKITSLYPEIKVIYISGYTDDVIVHHGMLDPDINFLEKPFTVSKLLSKIREVLDTKIEEH